MELKKDLGLLEIFCIGSGAMISSGLFILPGIAFGYGGPVIVVSYFLAGLLAMTGMLSIAEMATAMPKAGGEYFYITRGMGPAIGTMSGLLSWFSLSLKSAFALIGMAAFTVIILPGFDIKLIAVIISLFFMGVNILGVKESGRFQVWLVLSLLSLMMVYLFFGLAKINIEHFQPFMPGGVRTMFSTAGLVFTAYGGLLYIGSVAEEVKNPNKIIPLGLILSLVVVSILYTFMVFVTVGVLPAEELSGSLTPISDGARASMGQWGFIVLSIAAFLAFVSTANGGILTASRYPLSLSRDGLMPPFLKKISPRYKTPAVSIVMTTGFLIIFLLLDLEILVRGVSTTVILTNILSCIAIIIIRESRLQNYRPVFKCPLYPYVQIIGILGFFYVLFEMGISSVVISSLVVVIGFFSYWFYGRAKSDKEYALLYLVERMTSKDLTSYDLETELKEIIRVRDNIKDDHFDEVIKKSHMLDLEESLDMKEFFMIAAREVQKDLELSTDEVYQALINRESETTTVLNDYLAVPHLIVPGENVFTILVARCRKGIIFSERNNGINTVFVIAGSKDQRNFHLKALAAIAQIVNNKGFLEKWLASKSDDGLRDVLLLSSRRRDSFF